MDARMPTSTVRTRSAQASAAARNTRSETASDEGREVAVRGRAKAPCPMLVARTCVFIGFLKVGSGRSAGLAGEQGLAGLVLDLLPHAAHLLGDAVRQRHIVEVGGKRVP